MSGRPLKNYDLYIDKLQAYATACEITVEYRDEPGDGKYIPTRRKLVLDKDLPESTEIATFLHELGHSLDDTLYTKPVDKKMDAAYKAFYNATPTQKQKDLVVECEQRAWMYGRSTAKKLRIPLGKWFDSEESEALSEYRSHEAQNR